MEEQTETKPFPRPAGAGAGDRGGAPRGPRPPSALQKLLYRKLAREQRAAASIPDAEVLCLASPGSGILSALAWRMALLAAGEGGAEGICALTFNERSARELRRLAFAAARDAGLPPRAMQGAYIGTVHDFAADLLDALDPGGAPRALLDPRAFRLYLAARARELGFAGVRRERAMSLHGAAEAMADAWKTANDELLELELLPGRSGSASEALRRIRDSLDRDRALDGSLAARRALEALEALEALKAMDGTGSGAAGRTAGAGTSGGAAPPGGAAPSPPDGNGLCAAGSGSPGAHEDEDGQEPGAQDMSRDWTGREPAHGNGWVPAGDVRPGRPGRPVRPGKPGRASAGRAPEESGAARVPAVLRALGYPVPASAGDGRPGGAAPVPGSGGHLPLRHLLVEGFQDATTAQARLVSKLGAGARSLFLSGDDDRATAPGRGIGARNTPPFWGRRARDVVTVTASARASEEIARTAGAFADLSLPARRHPKPGGARRSSEPSDVRTFVFRDRPSEARWVAGRIGALLGTSWRDGPRTRGLTPGDFAILLRSPDLKELDRSPRHAAFAAELAAAGIPYRLDCGANPFDVPETAAILAACELAADPAPAPGAVRACLLETIRPVFSRTSAGRFEELIGRARLAAGGPPAGGLDAIPSSATAFFWELADVLRVSRLSPDAGLMDRLGTVSRMFRDFDLTGGGGAAGFRRLVSSMKLRASGSPGAPESRGGPPPDAVEICSVQAMGPQSRACVFVCDVEQSRFPARSGSYSGLLPREALQTALKRGAYRTSRDKEARLFYTALTRASRFLYVTGAAELPGARRPASPSDFLKSVRHIAEWDGRKPDPGALPAGLERAVPASRLDELARPSGFPEVLAYLACPACCELLLSRGLVPAPPAPARRGPGRPPRAADPDCRNAPGPPERSGAPPAGEAAGVPDVPPPAAQKSRRGPRAPEPAGPVPARPEKPAPGRGPDAGGPPLAESARALRRRGPGRFFLPLDGAVIAGNSGPAPFPTRPAALASAGNGGEERLPPEAPALGAVALDARDFCPAFPADASCPEGLWAAVFLAQSYLAVAADADGPGGVPGPPWAGKWADATGGRNPGGGNGGCPFPGSGGAAPPAGPGRPCGNSALAVLPDGTLAEAPADPEALAAARANLEWAVKGILARDFPARPAAARCRACGFRALCPARGGEFRLRGRPPALATPLGPVPAGALAGPEDGR
ncbi:MAG: UvrD-helicase domain-containing protein [Deltaproteobacteria bacterium]|jgi:superfamily I DNA/RNA helicase|nr:UvrD-helicase domain-containing protein [Deltaproteobacteria bacterium]